MNKSNDDLTSQTPSRREESVINKLMCRFQANRKNKNEDEDIEPILRHVPPSGHHAQISTAQHGKTYKDNIRVIRNVTLYHTGNYDPSVT